MVLFIAALVIFGAIFAHPVAAQPTVAVTVEVRDNYQGLLFTFLQDDLPSMEGCHYNLFAADSPRKLKTLPGGARSIATFFKPLSEIRIIAAPLPHLARKQGKHNPRVVRSVKAYFRVLLSCPDATDGYGAIFSIPIKTFRDGTQVNMTRLTHDMKYNMQYYNP